MMFVSSLYPSNDSPIIPSEKQLLQEISIYKKKLKNLEPGHPNLSTVYKTLLQYRHKLLAAIRDGKPDCWVNYPDSWTLE